MALYSDGPSAGEKEADAKEAAKQAKENAELALLGFASREFKTNFIHVHALFLRREKSGEVAYWGRLLVMPSAEGLIKEYQEAHAAWLKTKK